MANKTHKYVAFHFPWNTVGRTDGANILANNSLVRGLYKFIRQQKIGHRAEIHGASEMKGRVIIQ